MTPVPQDSTDSIGPAWTNGTMYYMAWQRAVVVEGLLMRISNYMFMYSGTVRKSIVKGAVAEHGPAMRHRLLQKLITKSMIRNNHTMTCFKLPTDFSVLGSLLTSKDSATLLYDVFIIMGTSSFIPKHTTPRRSHLAPDTALDRVREDCLTKSCHIIH